MNVNAKVKWESVFVFGAIIYALICIYFWTHQALRESSIAPTSSVKFNPTPTDWDKCLEGTAIPNLVDKTYLVMILNKCSVTMNDFSVSFKFYDSSDARVGWDAMSVSALQPSEKVKWKADLPLKTYPLTSDTVRIQIFSYIKVTTE